MQLSFKWRTLVEGLARPATWFIVASNLVPVAGALWWGWDAFLVLALYWCETLVIALWIILMILTRSSAQLSALSADTVTSPIGAAAFFAAHSGIFMTVHGGILWSTFGGHWQAGGIGHFLRTAVVDNGIGLAVVLMIIGHGLRVVGFFTGFRPFASVGRVVFGEPARVAPPIAEAPRDAFGPFMVAFYGRIIAMQLALIGGGFVAIAFGTMAPLVILIALKIMAEIGFIAAEDARKPQA